MKDKTMMEIEYEKEDNGVWYAGRTLLDADGDGLSFIMYLDGSGGYEIQVDTIDLNYVTIDDIMLKELNAFVSKAKKRLEILELEEEE